MPRLRRIVPKLLPRRLKPHEGIVIIITTRFIIIIIMPPRPQPLARLLRPRLLAVKLPRLRLPPHRNFCLI